MTQQSTLTVESTEVIPTEYQSFEIFSLDHTYDVNEAQERHERRVLNGTARLTQASEQLRREIKANRYVEERQLNEQQNLCRLLELQDRDLQIIAHEIHDGSGQQLVAAIMQLRTFIRLAK